MTRAAAGDAVHHDRTGGGCALMPLARGAGRATSAGSSSVEPCPPFYRDLPRHPRAGCNETVLDIHGKRRESV